MASFICQVLNSDGIPVPGIRVTFTSLQNPPLIAYTGLHGIASFWVHLSNGVPEPYVDIKPECMAPIARAKVVFEIKQSSLPRAIGYASLGPEQQSCIILRLLGTGFRIQYGCLPCHPLLHEASHDNEHGLDDDGSLLIYSNEEGRDEGTKHYMTHERDSAQRSE
jgi:hypothetical protein